MSGSLVVYESVPRNAAIFARLAPVKLTEVRSLMQLKRAIESEPATIVAVEITRPQNLPAASNLIHWIKQEQPQTAVIAMPLMQIPRANAWLYEAGTDAVFESMLDRETARKLIRRAVHRDRQSAKPSQSGSFRDRVVTSMPWKRFAS